MCIMDMLLSGFLMELKYKKQTLGLTTPNPQSNLFLCKNGSCNNLLHSLPLKNYSPSSV